MKKYRDILFVLVGFILGIVLIVGCGAKIDEDTTSIEEEVEKSIVTEEEPEETDEQEQAESEDCDSIISELESLKAKYEELQAENSELTAKYNKLLSDYDELTVNYSNLSSDYDELTVLYNKLLTEAPDITEDDVEQGIFERINAERKAGGLNELEWTDTFHQAAKEHSSYMADENVVEPSDQSYMQGVFRAAGYSTLDRIINAAIMVWEREVTYSLNFLNIHAEYGTVAAKKSGDIYYITYFAHTHK